MLPVVPVLAVFIVPIRVAYIKDSDGQIYRITQFSNNRWWFADDYNINEKVNATCGGKRYYAYNNYPACPAGWSVPTIAEINARWVNLPNNDAYGGAISVGYFVQQKTCYVDRGGRFDTIAKDCTPGAYGMGVDGWRACNDLHHAGRMRCLRQL